MEHQGIELTGPFIGQKLASVPTWSSDDEGREIFNTANHKKYIGSDSAWVEQNIDKIWTYQNTAPSGWSIVASTSDALIACKGGANAYNTTGGQQIGTWTQPNHLHTTGSHALSVAELAPHAHTLAVYAWDGSQHTARGSSDSALQASQATSSTGSGTAHNHGNTGNGATAATYRPLANLGIVIEKT